MGASDDIPQIHSMIDRIEKLTTALRTIRDRRMEHYHPDEVPCALCALINEALA